MVREIVEVAYLKWRGPNKDRAYWEPTSEMRAAGMTNTRLSGTKVQIHGQAETLNRQWDAIKKSKAANIEDAPLPDSVAFWVRKYAGVVDQKTRAVVREPSRKFRKLAPRTQKDYRYYLNDFFVVRFGVFPIKALTPKVIKTYYEATCDKRGDYFGYHLLIAMKAFFKWAASEEAVDENPARYIENYMPESRDQRWMPEQVDALCKKAVEMDRRSIMLAVRIADWIAQRPFDTRMLRWSNYDGSRLIDIKQSKKKRKVAPLPLPQYLIDLLDATPKESIYIIVSEGSKRPYSERGFDGVLADIRDKAGLPKDLQFRDFRRTAMTEGYDAGATDEQVRAFSAHANPSSMSPYRVLTETQGQVLMDKRLQHRAKRTNQGGEA